MCALVLEVPLFWSRNCFSSGKGCVINDHVTEASNGIVRPLSPAEQVRTPSTPPPPPVSSAQPPTLFLWWVWRRLYRPSAYQEFWSTMLTVWWRHRAKRSSSGLVYARCPSTVPVGYCLFPVLCQWNCLAQLEPAAYINTRYLAHNAHRDVEASSETFILEYGLCY